jgi:DNA-binding Lrp family transcriptional regulator
VILGTGVTRFLNRLAIDPSQRQAQMAKSLGFSRSAINQVWKKMEEDHNLKVRSNLDYGALGYHYVYGWGSTTDRGEAIGHLEAWLKRNPFTTTVYRSLMTSRMDTRIFFQALVPFGNHLADYLQSLERFRKRPYSLDVSRDLCSTIADKLNFGYYSNGEWNFESEYRFQASISAARSYASVLPTGRVVKQTTPSETDLVQSIIGASMESDYFVTSANVTKQISRFQIPALSERTLRRRISVVRRSIADAYIELHNIGLPKTVIITLKESRGADTYRVLQAQSSLFPKVRTLSGTDSLVLILEIPEQTDWFYISSAMSNIANSASEICTFIAEQLPFRRWLRDVVGHLLSKS